MLVSLRLNSIGCLAAFLDMSKDTPFINTVRSLSTRFLLLTFSSSLHSLSLLADLRGLDVFAPVCQLGYLTRHSQYLNYRDVGGPARTL